jgi:hypothetical protein
MTGNMSYTNLALMASEFENALTTQPKFAIATVGASSEESEELLYMRAMEHIQKGLKLDMNSPMQASEHYQSGSELLSRALLLGTASPQRLDEMQRALDLSSHTFDAEDAARRAVYLRRVPPEPLEGAAGNALLCVHTPAGSLVWRRFESSSTLEDLANFARSLPGVPLGSSLRLSNVTLAPHQPLNLETQIGLTLETLDMWPTAHVQVSDADAAPADAQP